MMTLPGLALFYGGLVRSKNMLNVLVQCFAASAIVGVLWVLIGYSLAFGDGNAFIGDFSKVGLMGITIDSVVGNFASPPRNIPEYVFAAFIAIWLLVVYCPIAHMAWASKGYFFGKSAIDFAGGLAVHCSAGFSALVAAIVIGKRKGFGKEPMPPHSLPLCLTGAGLLWAGWFGFNAGSALSASGLAALAFISTATAASAATLSWAGIEMLHRGKATALGAATAAVAGLVAILPACGNVSPLGAIAVGFGVAVICYAAVTFLKPLFGYDDSLDAFGVHTVSAAPGAHSLRRSSRPASVKPASASGEGVLVGAPAYATSA